MHVRTTGFISGSYAFSFIGGLPGAVMPERNSPRTLRGGPEGDVKPAPYAQTTGSEPAGTACA